MLVPQLILATIGYAIFTYTLSELDYVITRINTETLAIVELQKSLLQASMPANDYLIHWNKTERAQYKKIRIEVNRSFFHIKENAGGETDIINIITALESSWKKADALSLQILKSDKNNLPELHQLMKKMDRDFISIADGLNSIISILVAQTKDTHQLAKKSRLQIQILIFSVFLVGLLIAILTAYFLSKSILGPVNILRNGARKFAHGELTHRVEINTHDELAELALAFNNMAEMIQETQRILKHQATRDDLTGLLNRREFHNQLNNEFSNFERQQHPVCLFMLDIDYFKKVNDTYGHTIGDSVLREIALRIIQNIRPNDSAMRYGGEEFTVILPNTTPEDAFHIAERILKSISGTPVVANKHKLDITISIGIACLNESGHTDNELINVADEALYQSKGNGRNRITLGHMNKNNP